MRRTPSSRPAASGQVVGERGPGEHAGTSRRPAGLPAACTGARPAGSGRRAGRGTRAGAGPASSPFPARRGPAGRRARACAVGRDVHDRRRASGPAPGAAASPAPSGVAGGADHQPLVGPEPQDGRCRRARTTVPGRVGSGAPRSRPTASAAPAAPGSRRRLTCGEERQLAQADRVAGAAASVRRAGRPSGLRRGGSCSAISTGPFGVVEHGFGDGHGDQPVRRRGEQRLADAARGRP